MRADEQLVIVKSSSFVAAIAFGHHQEGVFVLFHVAIREPARAAKFRTPDLKPDEVVCVIDDSHLVGFRIADPQERLVPFSQGFRGGTCHMSAMPSNSAVRVSVNTCKLGSG